MKKLILILLAGAVTAGLTWLVWFTPVKTEEEEKTPEAEVPVHIGKITRGTLRTYVTAYGVVEPEPAAGARVGVGVPGVVTTVNCVEGQQVEQGALLFELDGRALEVAAGFAEKSLARQKALAQTEATSQKLLQDAEQLLASTRAQQDLLKIRSPLAGTLMKVNAKTGEAADLTSVLAEVVDLDRLVVSFNVPAVELAVLRAGQAVEVLSPASTNTVATALAFASPNVDPRTGSGVARARLAPHSGLKLGQFVRIRVTSEERKDCLTVPAASVAKDPAGATCIALVEDEKAVLKPVRVGVREGDSVEVEGEGVAEGKTVVTHGAYGLIMTQQFATRIRVVNE